jgi:hypothetical protein
MLRVSQSLALGDGRSEFSRGALYRRIPATSSPDGGSECLVRATHFASLTDRVRKPNARRDPRRLGSLSQLRGVLEVQGVHGVPINQPPFIP